MPVFKLGDETCANNHRPMSKVYAIAKISEKIIYDKLFVVLKSVISSDCSTDGC